MLSLFLQAFLVLFASMRQRQKSTLLLTLIWAAYLLADWIAAIAIGLITQSQGEEEAYEHPNSKGMFDQDLFSFWASFLLLHLGGPDTITSFALEDNEFWLRHLFGLILQVLAAAYSYYLTLPKNKLWPPTLLVFLVGIIKYAERTRALYLASLERFGTTALPTPDPGPDYEEASMIYSSRLLQFSTEEEMTAMMPSRLGNVSYDPDFDFENITTIQASDEMQLLRIAHKLFIKFKGLIVGFYLTTKEREFSKSLFLKKVDHKCAFRLIENELSFMFQVLHTKVVVLRQRMGYILRAFSFSSLVGALIYFFLVDKQGFGEFEIALTYALLIGAIILDSISAIKVILSEWTFIVLKKRCTKYVPEFISKRKRWSRVVFQYNMIDYCLNERPWAHKLAGYIHASDLLDKIKVMYFSTSYKITDELQKFIFDDLKRKCQGTTTLREAMEACQQRGDAALMHSSLFASYIKLKWSISEFQYTESVLLWHIATEICCLDDNEDERKKNNTRPCKILSDYMFYLLIMQPAMLSPVLGNWYLVFQDTCAEAKRFFNKYSISEHNNAVEKMKNVKTKFRPAAVKGIKSKSLFFDACILSQQLRKWDNRWEVMDLVWLEFMCYAAINCRPIIHAQQPSKGGELLTLTWLLMNHFGLGMQFSEMDEQAASKMVAVK